jgi:hypothetical protein
MAEREPVMDKTRACRLAGFTFFGAFFVAGTALGASHLWRVNEVFSSADGSIQFIELHECCGATAENFIGGHNIFCDVSGGNYVFPGHLVGNTANRYLLLATAAFAALPGAPTPDYIIPENFFTINGDTIRYSTIANYDFFTFNSGQLPTNGVDSIQLTNFTPDQFILAVNTPTNYAGQTGSVNVGTVPTVSQWGLVLMALLVLTVGAVALRRGRVTSGSG